MAATATVEIKINPLNTWTTITRALLTAQSAAAKLASTGSVEAEAMVKAFNKLYEIADSQRLVKVYDAAGLDRSTGVKVGLTDD